LAAYIYARADREAEARRLMDEIREASAGGYVTSFWLAVAHKGLGEREQALAQLERSYQARQALSFLNVDPCWDDLRPDPRFQDLLRRVGFNQD
jgi:hypothetical protein